MIDFNKLDDLLDVYRDAVRTDENSHGVLNAKAVRDAHAAILTYVRDNMPAAANAPFDEAAARAGKPIEGLNASKEWVPAHFVGVTQQGRIVVEFHDLCLVQLRPDEVRIAAPKMRTLYLNIATHHVGVYRNEADAKKHAAYGTIHIAYPVQVPE